MTCRASTSPFTSLSLVCISHRLHVQLYRCLHSAVHVLSCSLFKTLLHKLHLDAAARWHNKRIRYQRFVSSGMHKLDLKSVIMQSQDSIPGSIWQKLRASGIALQCHEVEQQPQLELGHAQLGLHLPIHHQSNIYLHISCGACHTGGAWYTCDNLLHAF